jgi:hypothetical protein
VGKPKNRKTGQKKKRQKRADTLNVREMKKDEEGETKANLYFIMYAFILFMIPTLS